jgi:hypothetical protein
MAWGIVASAGATLVGGMMASDSAGNAADAQAASSAASIAEQRRQYDQTREDYAPYRAAGTQALGEYQTAINGNTTAADALAEPGYQFGMQQGQLGLDRKAAAAGGRVSGAALKSAAEYATNYATTGYNAAYQRRQDRLNRLAALANVGQTATAGSAAAGSASANSIGGLMTAQGNASGAAQLAQGNIWAGTANQLGAAAQRWASAPKSAGTGYNSTFDSQGLNVALG